MTIELSDITDVLLFITGLVFLVISLLFYNLFRRYRKRDYFLLCLGFLAAAVQTVVGKLDVLFPENWESDVPNFLAAIFGFFMVILILFVLLFPQKVPINFEDELIKQAAKEE